MTDNTQKKDLGPKRHSIKNKEEMPKIGEEFQGSKEECQSFLERILDKISSRFVKKYLPPLENVLEETQFFIPVEFYECKNKQMRPRRLLCLSQVRRPHLTPLRKRRSPGRYPPSRFPDCCPRPRRRPDRGLPPAAMPHLPR